MWKIFENTFRTEQLALSSVYKHSQNYIRQLHKKGSVHTQTLINPAILEIIIQSKREGVMVI